jgi:hypothetical protein
MVYLGIYWCNVAPEELDHEAIIIGQYPQKVDPCRAEVFSMGLTILSAGVLHNCFSIYN